MLQTIFLWISVHDLGYSCTKYWWCWVHFTLSINPLMFVKYMRYLVI